jgi:DNA-binding transcriptional LysR family regulator
MSFTLSTEQCELLMAFDAAGSVAGAAKLLRRDESVISRQVKSMAAIAPVLEKSGKSWRISALGKDLVRWSRDSADSQRRLLSQQSSLKIATTHEFSARVLCPNISSLLGKEEVSLSIFTSDDGIETELISGRADVGIDCGRPYDPIVRFKTVIPEPYTIVAAPAFLKKFPLSTKESLLAAPHLRFNRDSALNLLELDNDLPIIFGSFNSLSSIRAACCAGLGWATLPRYCVASELKSNLLREVKGWSLQPRSFGVWWVRGREKNFAWIERTISWLGQQSL